MLYRYIVCVYVYACVLVGFKFTNRCCMWGHFNDFTNFSMIGSVTKVMGNGIH